MCEAETMAGLTYLFDIYIDEICRRMELNWEEFKKLNEKYGILDKITEFRELFNDWSLADGMLYIDEYVLKGEGNGL